MSRTLVVVLLGFRFAFRTGICLLFLGFCFGFPSKFYQVRETVGHESVGTVNGDIAAEASCESKLQLVSGKEFIAIP